MSELLRPIVASDAPLNPRTDEPYSALILAAFHDGWCPYCRQPVCCEVIPFPVLRLDVIVWECPKCGTTLEGPYDERDDVEQTPWPESMNGDQPIARL